MLLESIQLLKSTITQCSTVIMQENRRSSFGDNTIDTTQSVSVRDDQRNNTSPHRTRRSFPFNLFPTSKNPDHGFVRVPKNHGHDEQATSTDSTQGVQQSEPQALSPIFEQPQLDPRAKEIKKTIRSRKRLIRLRNLAEIELRDFGYTRMHHASTRDQLLLICQEIEIKMKPTKNLDLHEIQTFGELFGQLRQNDAKLKEQDTMFEKMKDKLSATQDQLIRLDNRLMQLEWQMLGKGDSESEKAEDYDEEPVEGSDVAATLSVHSESSFTHPDAKLYYDKVGDMILAREHIHNLDTEYQSDLYCRKSQRDMGVKLRTSDTALYNEYSEQRKELMNEYYAAELKAEGAWTRCQRLGIRIEKAEDRDVAPPERFGGLPQSGSSADSRTAVWVKLTSYSEQEDVPEKRSSFAPNASENLLARRFPTDEPIGFLPSSQPPSETEHEQLDLAHSFIGEKPSRRHSNPDLVVLERPNLDKQASGSRKDRSVPSAGVVFGAP